MEAEARQTGKGEALRVASGIAGRRHERFGFMEGGDLSRRRRVVGGYKIP